MKQTGFPKGRKGYVVDDIVPMECGGADAPAIQSEAVLRSVGADFGYR
jgi:hypothetical protein